MQNYIEVTVGGRPLREFSAKMQSWPGFYRVVDAEVFQGVNRSTMQLLKNRRGVLQMHCFVDFFGTNQERTANQSAFEALFLGLRTVEIDIGDGFLYQAVLVQPAETATVGELFTTAEYRFQVTRHRTPCSVSLHGYDPIFYPDDGTIYCQSNVERTDCRITIDLPSEITSEGALVRLNGYEWSLPASYIPDAGTQLIIDGINKVFLTKTTTQSGIVTANVTNKMTWSDFPFLVPGENLIKVAVEGAAFRSPVTVEYTPAFL